MKVQRDSDNQTLATAYTAQSSVSPKSPNYARKQKRLMRIRSSLVHVLYNKAVHCTVLVHVQAIATRYGSDCEKTSDGIKQTTLN